MNLRPLLAALDFTPPTFAEEAVRTYNDALQIKIDKLAQIQIQAESPAQP